MKLILALVALIAAQTPVLASTMTVTFDGPSTGDDIVHGQSQGFHYQSSSAYASGEDIVLHDDGGITRTVLYRPDGRPFTPKAIDVAAVSLIYRTGNGPAPANNRFMDWTMEGHALQPVFSFLGVSAQRAVKVSFGPDDLRQGEGQLLFSDLFADISELWIEIAFPDSLPRTPDGDVVHVRDPSVLSKSGTDWCYEYCGELRVDNLIVVLDGPAPVPLPASALLLGAALLGLGAARRRI